MIRTMIQLTEDQVEGLRSLATRDGTSLAAEVRRAVDRLLVEASTKPPRHRSDALGVVGLFDSGTPGIARAHDAELADAFAAHARRAVPRAGDPAGG